jgi:hypothetical protein
VAWKNAVDANKVAPPVTSARLVPLFWRPSPFSRSKDEAEEAEGGENSANLLPSFRLVVVVVIVLLALPAKEEEEEEEESRALLAVILSAVVLVIVVVVVVVVMRVTSLSLAFEVVIFWWRFGFSRDALLGFRVYPVVCFGRKLSAH